MVSCNLASYSTNLRTKCFTFILSHSHLCFRCLKKKNIYFHLLAIPIFLQIKCTNKFGKLPPLFWL